MGVYLHANDPVIQLEMVPYEAAPRRVQTQIDEIQQLDPPLTIHDPVFGDSLAWPFCEYTVSVGRAPGRTGAGGMADRTLTPASVLGADPPQPVPHTSSETPPTDGNQPSTRLCLFNVIVALEWQATPQYIQQLKWAFRQASDFLFDVTDGYFAFGQVVIGGPELMNCADIQMMASNRLLPRSWVSGLHEAQKYMPIRVGRGIWHKNNRVSIPWDEPEAYRTLVHEWAHYALELRDAYLETHYVSPTRSDSHANGSDYVLMRGDYPLVIPQISITTESIMATLEGTSELVPQITSQAASRQESPWEMIRKKNRYRFLNFDPNHRTLEGPGRLPLPLPTFHTVGSLANAATEQPAEAILANFPKHVQFDHCWAYVIKGDLTAPHNLIAQGSIDARAQQRGFRLLGVAAGDTVVLIGKDHGDRAIVMIGAIDAVEATSGKDASVRIKQWVDATPAHFPMIDVLPGGDLHHNNQMAVIAVNVQGIYDTAWIFPFGQGQPQKITPNTFNEVPTLDGHVLVTWEQGKQLVIGSFSQGGNPQTGTPTGGPPITAGSSEGNSMVFFADKEQIRDYSDTKIVTTVVHVDPDMDTLPDGAQARSYTFSLSSNTALPTELAPTLILYFDRDAIAEDGDLLIYRQKDLEGSAWTQVPTYRPTNSFFAAAPLNAETAERLVATQPAARVERYRLYWKPRSSNHAGKQPNIIT